MTYFNMSTHALRRRLAPFRLGTRAPARIAAALAGGALIASCQPAYDGYFEPVPAPGIAFVRDADGNRAARLRHGDLTVTIAGDWGNLREEAFTLIYTNTGAPVTLRPGRMRLVRPAAGPDTPTPGLTVEVMQGEDYSTRQVMVDFDTVRLTETVVTQDPPVRLLVSFNDHWNSPELKDGDRVRLLVPLGDQGRLVTLKVRKPWLSFL